MPARTTAPDALLTIDQAAEHLNVSLRWMRRQVADRRIRHVKIAGSLRFRQSDLDAFVDAGVREAVVR